jgi:hypothetical protein
MTENVTLRNTYTVSELAGFCLPGLPKSRKNWYARLRKDPWPFIERPGNGPGGIVRAFIPPPDVQAMIDARSVGAVGVSETARDGEPADSRWQVMSPKQPEYAVNRPFRAGAVDAELLGRVLVACSAVLGRDYDVAPPGDQAVAAAGVYNALLQMVSHLPRGADALRRLDQEGLNSLMVALLQMGAIQPVPPSKSGG